ncbi:hypothetical protein [Phenylobacterium sp.]|uniref:hypothetical protein n=1 Tax=Phenylobacterium sp. TaxID=1871053 RepID=UPI0026384284|nr:hypothetical protein [Phenylobacterium sp.]
MTDLADMAGRHEAVLKELTAVALTAARELGERLSRAEADESAAALGLALSRMTRSVRQCLALESKLAQARQKLAREAAQEARDARARQVEVRKDRLAAAVTRAIYTEHERDSDEADEALALLDDSLDEAALSPEFLLEEIGAQVETLCADLGLDTRQVAPAVAAYQGDRRRPDSGRAEDIDFDAAPPPERRSSG